MKVLVVEDNIKLLKSISDELNNKSLYEIKIDNNISKRTIVIATINKKETKL